MRRQTLLILILWTTLVHGSNQRVSYSGYQVIAVTPNTKDDLEFLRSLRSHKVKLWNDPVMLNRPVVMLLSPDVKNDVRSQLQNKYMNVRITHEDLQKDIDKERMTQTQNWFSMHNDGFNFAKYHNLPEIMDFMRDISGDYSDITELDSIGNTFENRTIDLIKIGSTEENDKPLVIIECGVHAREWISTAFGVWLMNELVTRYEDDEEVTELIDEFEFIIIPVANPDGYFYSHTMDRLWKTNRNANVRNANVCLGVDINRNFDIEFKNTAMHEVCEDEYAGNHAFSEGETIVLRDLMEDNKDRIVTYFDIHNLGQKWMTPFGYTNETPSDYNELKRIGEIGVQALTAMHGTEYEFGTVNEVMYPATGIAIDYAYKKVGIKISYSVALRDDGDHDFLLPEDQIIPTCEETYAGIIAAIQALEI